MAVLLALLLSTGSAAEALPPPAAGTIEVEVVDDITRAGVAEWNVYLECECLEERAMQLSGTTGAVSFTGLPPGRYTIQDLEGYTTGVVLKADAKEGERTEIRVRDNYPARSPERFAAGTLTWSGVGVVGIGATLVGGAVLASSLTRCNRDGANPINCTEDLRSSWSIALATVGAASVGAGAAMIAVGRKRRLALGPTMSFRHRGGVVGLRARF